MAGDHEEMAKGHGILRLLRVCLRPFVWGALSGGEPLVSMKVGLRHGLIGWKLLYSETGHLRQVARSIGFSGPCFVFHAGATTMVMILPISKRTTLKLLIRARPS